MAGRTDRRRESAGVPLLWGCWGYIKAMAWSNEKTVVID
jgi:hypothetical protein